MLEKLEKKFKSRKVSAGKSAKKQLNQSKPDSNQKKHRPFYQRWSFYLRAGLLAGLASLVLAAAGFFIIVKDLPSPEKIKERQVAESTKIFDRTGKYLLYEVHGEEKRTVVPLDQISDDLKKATIAIEDDQFYNHKGINFKSILRAVLRDFTGAGYHQGASTITQQFIKNSILSSEKTITRKIKEVILSLELERKFSKDQILEMYLNEIPFGSNAYGAEAASLTFFGKNAKDLNLAEAAMLASLPQAPTRLSPYGSRREELFNRQKLVLNKMLEQEFITSEEKEQALAQTITFQPDRQGIIAPHFVIYVREQIADKFGENFIEQEGLKVYTTLDYDKQMLAEKAIVNGAKNNLKFNATNAALTALNPKTGEILAMVGSKDYFDESIDGNVNVALALRQPGSSFKPFAYARAFEKGFTPDTLLFDLRTNFGPDGSGKDYIPQNYNLKEYGPVTMRTALANSLNIPAVKTLYLAGVEETIELAQRLGINSLYDRDRFGLALVLGGGEVRLLDEVSAFGLFATEGIKHNPISILKIVNKQGDVVEEIKPEKNQGEEVLNPQIARYINSILSDNQARNIIFSSRGPLYIPGRQVAAKTGTTQAYRDAWTVGYTPSLAAGVWVGNNNNEPMKLALSSMAAAPIWHSFMAEALANSPVETFTPPEKKTYDKMVLHGKFNEKAVRLCKINNLLATDKVPMEETYEKTYKEIHSILYYVNRNDPAGPIPTNLWLDPQYERWEQEVRKWVKKQGISLEDAPTETCENLYADTDRPQVTITEPKNGSTVEDGQISVQAEVSSERQIKKVEYFFNDQLFGADVSEPYEDSFTSHNPPGVYTLKVKAYDEIGSVGFASININLKNNNFIYLTKPKNSIILTKADFPFTLEAIAASNQGVNQVNFFYKDKSSASALIGSSPANGNDNKFSLIWQNMPGPKDNKNQREIEVFAISINTDGSQVTSNPVAVNLKYEEEEVGQ